MKSLQKIIGASLFPLALIGCGESPEFQEGEVTKESLSASRIEDSSGAFFGNDSVKLTKPTYVLNVKTRQGEYIISVKESYKKPLDALAEAIEVGDRIKFRLTLGKKDLLGNDIKYFSEDRIGSLYSKDIVVINE